MSIRVAYLRDISSKHLVQFQKVMSDVNAADIFTKSFGKIKFNQLRDLVFRPQLRRPVEWESNFGLQDIKDNDLQMKINKGDTIDNKYI